jgi:capsular polysaccharide biosynthesis protein
VGMDEVGGSWFEPRRVLPRWWVLVVAALIAVGVAVLASRQSTTLASTESTYVLSAASNMETPFDVSSSLDVLRGREVISTFADVLESTSIRDSAVAKTPAPNASAYVAKAELLPGSNIVKLTVSGPASGYAQDVATYIGEEASTRFVELYPIYRVDALDAPATPVRSITEVIRNVFLAAVVAVVAAALVSAVVPLGTERRLEPTPKRVPEPVPLLDESIVARKEPEPTQATQANPAPAPVGEDGWRWRHG